MLQHNEQHLNNSGSSIFCFSSPSKPNDKQVIYALAILLREQIEEDQAQELAQQNAENVSPTSKQNQNQALLDFSEDQYIPQNEIGKLDPVLLQQLHEQPSIEQIAEFIRTLYSVVQFSVQSCIVALVYINRFVAFTEARLQPNNWRPLIMCALLVAQKFLDDNCASTASFAEVYPFFTTEEVSRLEVQFLSLLQHRTNVSSNIYLKYYYAFREVYRDDDEFKNRPLDMQSAKQVEIKSQGHENQLQFDKKEFFTRSGNRTELYPNKAKAIIN